MTVAPKATISARAGDQPNLKRIADLLTGKSVTLASGNQKVNLPPSVLAVLRSAVEVLRHGGSTSVVSDEQELSTQEVAELLNMSRQYVVRLVEKGTLPATTTNGGHRRLRLRDVLDFKRTQDARRSGALSELDALTDEYGGYEPLKR